MVVYRYDISLGIFLNRDLQGHHSIANRLFFSMGFFFFDFLGSSNLFFILLY